jgi:hypothetical protein
MALLPPGQTLQPTALVHEAYLRLIDTSDVSWESRQHFFFAAACAMRDILVEQARRKAGPVRGGRRRQELDEALCRRRAAGGERPGRPRGPGRAGKTGSIESPDRAAALLQRADDGRDGGSPRPRLRGSSLLLQAPRRQAEAETCFRRALDVARH